MDERAADLTRTDDSWQGNRDGSRAVKSTGPTFERPITAAAAAAGATIATAAAHRNRRGITKTRPG